jgi:hypothetical protein
MATLDSVDRDRDNVDDLLRTAVFDGNTWGAVFGETAQWLAAKDGAVTIRALQHHVLTGEPNPLVLEIYYYPE